MEASDLIKGLKEIIRCLEVCHDPNNDANQEIQMWRERYLNSIGFESQDTNHHQLIYNALIFCPSEEMIKQTPEKIVETSRKYNEQN